LNEGFAIRGWLARWTSLEWLLLVQVSSAAYRLHSIARNSHALGNVGANQQMWVYLVDYSRIFDETYTEQSLET
jgi:hypothetical protein